MKKSNERILILLEKFEKGEVSGLELDELDRWYSSFENDAKYTIDLTESQQFQKKEDLFLKINKQLAPEFSNAKSYPTEKHFNLWLRLEAAAIVIIGLSVGGYFLSRETSITLQTAKIPAEHIAPGGNKAFLTLANGKKISLTDAKIGEVAKQQNIKITKTATGQINYAVTDQVSSLAASPDFNKIETPKGGQYQVNLPDGTKAWLNAASSLKYPTSFKNLKERKVELTGEAYFEVAHDKSHPFLVETNKQTVTVLGTHFDVNAYADEPVVRTTLLEGSVGINAGLNHLIIKPGQQALLTQEKLTVISTDGDDAVSWKNGMFQFSHEKLESIMRKISRWYNVDIEYKNENVKSLPLSGIITCFSDVYKVLHMLELTKQVHFKIEGRKIIVLK